MEFRADIHCHSIYSDGFLTPQELVLLAVKNGLKGISITDHDTILAYDSDLIAFAKAQGVELLTGIEISSLYENTSVHILGYNFLLDSADMLAFLQKQQEKRNDRNLKILAKLTLKGFSITLDELKAFASKKNVYGSLGRPHIAHLMVEKGYVRSYQEAFNMYIQDGGCCYVPGEKPTPQEVISVIHQSKGRAILAHPHQIDRMKIVQKLLEFPFDGMECYYGTLLPTLEHRWVELAKKKNILITGGSDFHGFTRPGIDLGSSWVNEETFRKLKSR